MTLVVRIWLTRAASICSIPDWGNKMPALFTKPLIGGRRLSSSAKSACTLDSLAISTCSASALPLDFFYHPLGLLSVRQITQAYPMAFGDPPVISVTFSISLSFRWN